MKIVALTAGIVCSLGAVAGEFSPSYFWIWNDRLEPAKLTAQLDDMRAHGLTSVCIHPWPSRFRPDNIPTSWMQPEYLSPEYLSLYKQIVEEAAKRGMESWLYDEGGWPSGGAAGQVGDSDPELRFAAREIGNDDPQSDDLHRRVVPYEKSGRGTYPSMLEPGATERFLSLTHEKYLQTFGGAFPPSITRAFTDEPAPHSARYGRYLSITSDFDAEFRRRKGYDFAPIAAELRSLYTPWSESYAQHRIDYFDVIADLFVERYLLPLRDWCRKHGLKSSGHFCSDEGLFQLRSMNSFGALLRNLRCEDAPGIDVIWRQLYPGDNGLQTPIPRYASSIARQNGSRVVLSESFGVYGNALPPILTKWVCDYQLVRGVNKLVFGYYYYATHGGWMQYLEPTIGPCQPWWDMTTSFHRYLENVAAFLAEGTPVVDVAVYFDQRGTWAGGPDGALASTLHQTVAKELDKRPCDFDFVDDEALATAVDAEKGTLKIGRMTYRTLVLPTKKWMAPAARETVKRFAAAGGLVVGPEELARVKPLATIRGRETSDLRVTKRRLDNGEVRYFIVNENITFSRDYAIDLPERGVVVRYDPETGTETRLERRADGRLADSLAPGESRALRVLSECRDAGVPVTNKPRGQGVLALTLKNNWSVRRAVAHRVGKSDFEIVPVSEEFAPTKLGDWRGRFGEDFSGKAVYRVTFNSPQAREMTLDLGKVSWAASATFNGQPLAGRFAPPWRWRVPVRKGENVLEVTVANLLVNALNENEHRRITKDFPPKSVYADRQAVFDRDYRESGLFGPVTLLSVPPASCLNPSCLNLTRRH